MELDIWIGESSNYYKYITLYIDNLLIASKNPKVIIITLLNKYKFKLKGTGSIKYYIRCICYYNIHYILYFEPKKYIEKIIYYYFSIFSSKLVKSNTTLNSIPKYFYSYIVEIRHNSRRCTNCYQYSSITLLYLELYSYVFEFKVFKNKIVKHYFFLEYLKPVLTI